MKKRLLSEDKMKEKKTILLIEPGARYTIFPPIGLMYLASALRKEYTVVIKDYSGEELDSNKIKEDIWKLNPFIVGVRVLTGPPIPRAIKVSQIAKELGKIVVWGGPHPTVLPEQTLKEGYVDAVIIGEGEYSFQELIKHYDSKKSKLDGSAIKIDGKTIVYPPQKKFVNLNKSPLPAWDLLENINKYFPNKKDNFLPLSTTRGCAFMCGFCHNSNKNVKRYLGCYRIADPKRAIEEYKFVQSLVKNKIEILDVGEDLHLVSEGYAKRFCEELKKSGLNLKWETSARYQTLNEELIDLIADSGCIRILLGVESGSERLQKMNNKIINLKKAAELAKRLRKRGIFVTNAYIIGHPTETTEELKMTLNYLKKIPADENLIQLYRPMPGTPYFQICLEKEKVKMPEKLEDWEVFGVLGHDMNVSEIPSKLLFRTFYKVNAVQQTKYWFNQQRFFLRNRMFKNLAINFLNNRFTFKLKEYLNSRK
jgi:radical SAM superfamily enzyme YgiQ (UPF0313 family)